MALQSRDKIVDAKYALGFRWRRHARDAACITRPSAAAAAASIEPQIGQTSGTLRGACSKRTAAAKSEARSAAEKGAQLGVHLLHFGADLQPLARAAHSLTAGPALGRAAPAVAAPTSSARDRGSHGQGGGARACNSTMARRSAACAPRRRRRDERAIAVDLALCGLARHGLSLTALDGVNALLPIARAVTLHARHVLGVPFFGCVQACHVAYKRKQEKLDREAARPHGIGMDQSHAVRSGLVVHERAKRRIAQQGMVVENRARAEVRAVPLRAAAVFVSGVRQSGSRRGGCGRRGWRPPEAR